MSEPTSSDTNGDNKDSDDKDVAVSSNTASDSSEPAIRRTKGIFIAVPLVCKFVIVLMIKFVTDLIVFPLLLLYRLVRLAKRRFLKLLGRTGDSSANSI